MTRRRRTDLPVLVGPATVRIEPASFRKSRTCRSRWSSLLGLYVIAGSLPGTKTLPTGYCSIMAADSSRLTPEQRSQRHHPPALRCAAQGQGWAASSAGRVLRMDRCMRHRRDPCRHHHPDPCSGLAATCSLSSPNARSRTRQTLDERRQGWFTKLAWPSLGCVALFSALAAVSAICASATGVFVPAAGPSLQARAGSRRFVADRVSHVVSVGSTPTSGSTLGNAIRPAGPAPGGGSSELQ